MRQTFCARFVAGFAGRQIAQQFSAGSIRAARRCLSIKILGLALHRFCFSANFFDPQIGNKPNRLTGIKPSNMLALDQRNKRPKPRFMKRNQLLAMGIFFFGHIRKQSRAIRILSPQLLRKTTVNSRTIFFRGNCKRPYFLL